MKHLRCKLKGHQLKKIEKESILIQEYRCTCCGQKYTTDGYGTLVRLTKHWERNNLLFENYLGKRMVS
tara:strand:+ start:11830 stop:12033 length:204 start_codon:yes stop_codon:yes gene_type:complete